MEKARFIRLIQGTCIDLPQSNKRHGFDTKERGWNMNLLLAFILSVVMAVSGVAPLPAQSETATEWTLSNVLIGDGTEFVQLDKQLVLTASACAGGATLQMKVLNGDQVMLPASASLTNEKLLLSFGSGNNAYSFDNEMIMGYAEFSEEEEQLFDIGTDFMLSLGAVAAKLRDKDYMEQLGERLTAAEDKTTIREKDTEVDIDGVLYPGKYITREYTDADSMLEMKNVDCTDMPELEALMNSLAQVLCCMEEIDPEKGFSGLAELYASDPDLVRINTSETVTAEADGVDYTATRTVVKDAEGNIISRDDSDFLVRDESALFRIHSDSTLDEESTVIEADLSVTGPLDAPVKVDLTGKLGVRTDYSYDTEKDGRQTRFIRTAEDRVEFDLAASSNAGLWSGSLNLGFDQISERGYESDRFREQESAHLTIGCTENRIGGDLLRSYVLEAAMDSDMLYLSFDVLEKKVPCSDPMEGLTLYEIDLADESMTPQNLALMADVMSFSGSAMLLGAQPDVMSASVLLDELNYADYEELDSIEEAREYLGVPLPEYTPPAGYALDSIRKYWDLGDLDFCYWSEAEQKSIVVTYTDFRGELPYSGLDEEKLKKGPIVQAKVEDGLIYYVDVYTPEVHVCIAADGVRAEMLETLLAGLDVVPLYMDEAELAEYRESQKSKL